MERQQTCEERIGAQMRDRLADLEALTKAQGVGDLDDVAALEDDELRTATDIGWESEDAFPGVHVQRPAHYVPARVVRLETCENCGEAVDAETGYDRAADVRCRDNDGTVVGRHEPDGVLVGVEVAGEEIDADELRERADETLSNYGLALSRVTVLRWELSTGGPGDRFEVEIDEDGDVSAGSYVFLDWFDRAERSLGSDDLDLIQRALGGDLSLYGVNA